MTVFGCEGRAAEVVLREVYELCLELHRLWSFTLDDSDIAQINKPVTSCQVDYRTALLLTAMKAFHAVEPSFDFTVGPVSYLWKHAKRIPSEEALSTALAHVGADKIVVEGHRIVKTDPLAQVDVGGAAKGFAADAIAAHVCRAGIASARIDLGGNLYLVGPHPSGRLWRVGIKVPSGLRVEQPVVQVRDASVVTSGNYERFVEIDGVRYQHIIDAQTGWPSSSEIVSASVVDASSLQADMLATTALLVGAEGLPALRERHPEAQIIALNPKGALL